MTSKLCVNCRHYNASPTSPTSCTEPRNYVPDYVSGERARIIYSSAQGARLDTSMCGPEAKWFEERTADKVAA